MSIEDVNFLKKNSIRQTYTFLVDSKGRDKSIYPSPSEYVIEFSTPFKNVVGLEVIDVSIPKTMYNIDYNNNTILYYLNNNSNNLNNDIPIILNNDNEEIYDKSIFSEINIPVGDYTTNTFLNTFKTKLFNLGINLEISGISIPPELTNIIKFTSTNPFILDMNNSTMAEILGFDLFADKNEKDKYTYKDYNIKKGFERLYHSILNKDGIYEIIAPGMMYLMGNKYIILKCPEIEEHLYRSLSYSKYSLGLAKFRINSYGYNDEKVSITKIPLREFHPIGKLAKITLKFVTDVGELYNFKGVNHNIVFAIYYYEPKQENLVKTSILNPNYNPNFIEYLYINEEQEGESDEEEEDFSRDNIELYKKNELIYNNIK